MIADSIAFLVAAGKRVLFDAEHFFDGSALDPGYALADAARRRRGGRRAAGPVRHQRRLAAAQIRTARRGRARGAAASRARDPHPQRLWLRGREHARGGRGRRDPGAGDDQRDRRADGQREPRHDHRRPPAQARAVALLAPEHLARLTETAHFVDELLNARRMPPSRTSASTPSRTRRAARRWRAGRREHLRARRTGARGQPPRRDRLRALGSRDGAREGRRAGLELGDRTRPADGRAGQAARAPGLPVRGRRRVLRAADAPRGRRLRAALPPRVLAGLVEKRADGKVETEATIKIWIPTGGAAERR